MNISIVKYNAGNTQSVAFALDRLGIRYLITDVPEEIQRADKVIFPGVGEASSTMKYLRDKKLDNVIVNLKQPVLGICLGMQLLCRHSDENNTTCLGVFDESVQKFTPTSQYKVPHTGWNSLTSVNGWVDPFLQNQLVYFVHSYYVPVNRFTTATTEYTVPFSAAMKKNNFYAVQFHPEKSAGTGEKILKIFLSSSV
ncbi:MAG: imidazole glycerol phosphate synthase subunit HisH [Bacteroidetes bacterium]|nr:imidazole glycerol phosphate synthase subunit HisH [Bacteroidota bacterium]